MALQTRRGDEADFQPNKMLPGEPAGTLNTKKVFYTFAPGDCRRLATHEEMTELIDESVEIIKQSFTVDLEQAITDSESATTAASSAAQLAEGKAQLADEATTRATIAAQNAESIVLGDIANDTTVGVVKSGGDVVVGGDGEMTVPDKLDKIGDSSNNTIDTITAQTEDTDIIAHDSHGIIIGKILKRFATIATSLADKFNKSDIIHNDTTNDPNKLPSSAVTFTLGKEIDTITDNIAPQAATVPVSIPGASGSLLFVKYGKIVQITGVITCTATLAPGTVLVPYTSTPYGEARDRSIQYLGVGNNYAEVQLNGGITMVNAVGAASYRLNIMYILKI